MNNTLRMKNTLIKLDYAIQIQDLSNDLVQFYNIID